MRRWCVRVLLWSWAAGAVLAPPVAAATVEPSETCGTCHRTIHETWKQSAHARSMEEPFLQALRDTQAAGPRRAALCLDCHAPLAELTGDRDLKLRLTWEGVNCDVCHGLESVDLSGHGPIRVVRPGPVKRGPRGDGEAGAHEVARSELHTSSLACAWCHEYVNPEGTPILTTYSEWKQSGSAERGFTCQSCHMAAARSGVVDPRADRLPGEEINLHRVPGGHSLEQLNKALGVSIASLRSEDELELALEFSNKGAGHAVPTGMPGRRVILELVVRASDGRRFEESKTYGKFFRDAAGKSITRDGGYFAPGVKLESDTRFRPDERRSERFRFPIGKDQTAYATVRLHYEHAPLGDERGRTYLTFFSEKRTIVPMSEQSP